MPDIRFLCPECKARLEVDESVAGYQVPCPTCNQLIPIPFHTDPEMSEPSGKGSILTEDEVKYLSQP